MSFICGLFAQQPYLFSNTGAKEWKSPSQQYRLTGCRQYVLIYKERSRFNMSTIKSNNYKLPLTFIASRQKATTRDCVVLGRDVLDKLSISACTVLCHTHSLSSVRVSVQEHVLNPCVQCRNGIIHEYWPVSVFLIWEGGIQSSLCSTFINGMSTAGFSTKRLNLEVQGFSDSSAPLFKKQTWEQTSKGVVRKSTWRTEDFYFLWLGVKYVLSPKMKHR